MNHETEIQSVIDRMAAAFAAHDIEGILYTYEPSAVVVGEPERPESGSAALRALFQRFIDINPGFVFHGHQIIEAGDLAMHLSKWSMTGTLPDGTPIEDGGLSVVVLRRQPDGRWLMVIDNPYGDHLMKV